MYCLSFPEPPCTVCKTPLLDCLCTEAEFLIPSGAKLFIWGQRNSLSLMNQLLMLKNTENEQKYNLMLDINKSHENS